MAVAVIVWFVSRSAINLANAYQTIKKANYLYK